MEKLVENLEPILAVVGAFLVALRLLVALTPTPKDDQLFKKVTNKWEIFLGCMAKVGGVDTTQGVGKKPNVKKNMMVSNVVVGLTMSMMFLFTGCQSYDTLSGTDEGQLVLHQKAFLSALKTLTLLNEADKFTEEQMDDLQEIVLEVDSYLLDWETSVKVGVPRPDIMDLVDELMEKLSVYLN